MRTLVIIHGWSDKGSSFTSLATALTTMLPHKISTLMLADYISMDDEVTFHDLLAAMNQAWRDAGLPVEHRAVDVIVHSTGALVLRQWLVMLREQGKPIPIYRCLMLAPANFGSPLAHLGEAWFSRLFKGFNQDHPFDVGSSLLHGLELGSAFTWELASKEQAMSEPIFGPHEVLASVIVGDEGYHGWGQLLDQSGTDGTVSVTGTRLDPVWLRCSIDEKGKPSVSWEPSKHKAAWFLLAGENHASLLDGKKEADDERLGLYVSALTVEEHEFEAWCALSHQRCQSMSETDASSDLHTTKRTPVWAYQHTVLRVVNQWGDPVPDFTLECMPSSLLSEDMLGIEAYQKTYQREVEFNRHTYSGDSSYHAYILDARAYDELSQGGDMRIGVDASPNVLLSNHHVGYMPSEKGRMWLLDKDHPWVMAHRVLCIDIQIPRIQKKDLFEFHDIEKETSKATLEASTF